jgi:hypothetical protein
MKIEFVQEICCDYCGDGIHVHMEECPACKKKYADTNIYGNMWEAWDHKEIPEFICEKCMTTFKASKTLVEILKGEGIYYTEWEISK